MKFEQEGLSKAKSSDKKEKKDSRESKNEKFLDLDPTVKERVRNWSKEWLQNFYNTAKTYDGVSEFPFDFGNNLQADIAELVGEGESFRKGLLTEVFSQGVHTFLLEFIDFVKIKASVDSNNEELKNFLQACARSIFYGSSDITESLRLTERLILISVADRIPELSEITFHFDSETIYLLNYQDNSLNESILKISRLSIAQKLDVINYLRKMSMELFFNEDDPYDVIDRIKYILSGIAREDPSPLIVYACEVVFLKIRSQEQLLNQEESGISEDEFFSDYDEREVVDNEQFTKESKQLKTQVGSIDEIEGDFGMVASNAVSVFDSSLVPRKIAIIDPLKIVLSNKIFIPHDNLEFQTVRFSPYTLISKDPNMVPFNVDIDSEELSLLIQYLHEPKLKNNIERDLGIKFSEIPLRSQIHFLRFLAGQDSSGFNRLRTILQKHSDISNKILNSFLACAENVGYSESILTIAENFDTDTAQAIYDKYLEISSASEQIRDFIYRQTNITGITDNQIQKITQKLLHRANEILKSFAQKSSPAEDTPDERERVLKDLEIIKDEAWLITSTFSTLRDSGVAVEFKDIVNMNPEIVTGLELARNRKDVEKMLEIFYDNYHKYPAEFRDSIIDGFRQKLAFDTTDFYILRYKGEIVSFFRFDRRFETDGMFKDFYFGSVNTDTGFTGGRFAEVMFSEALKARAKEGVIEADCDPETEVSSKYIEQGFVATKYYVYKGVPSLGLILNQELNSRLRAKNLSRAEIESLENSPELFVVKYNRGEKVDFSKLSQGYVLSRYIKTKEDILCVFEKI